MNYPLLNPTLPGGAYTVQVDMSCRVTLIKSGELVSAASTAGGKQAGGQIKSARLTGPKPRSACRKVGGRKM